MVVNGNGSGTFKLVFDRARTVFPTSIRLNEPINDVFRPVILYEIAEPTDIFFGARVSGAEHLLWSQTLTCPDDIYPCSNEIVLSFTDIVTMEDFVRELIELQPSETKLMRYDWLLGHRTADGGGFVTDVWDATTLIQTSEIGLGTIAAVVGLGAIFVGALLYKGDSRQWAK